MSRSRRKTEQPISLFSFQDIITSVTGVMVLLTLLMALELIHRVLASPPQQTIVQIDSSGQSAEEMQEEIANLRRQLESSSNISATLPSYDLITLHQLRNELDDNSRRLEQQLLDLNEKVNQKQRQVGQLESTSAAQSPTEKMELQNLETEISEMRQTSQSMQSSNRLFFKKDKDGKATWLVEIDASQAIAAEIGVTAKPKHFPSRQAFKTWLSSLDPASTAFYIIVKPDGASSFESYKEAVQSQGFDTGFHLVAADQQVIDPNTGASIP